MYAQRSLQLYFSNRAYAVRVPLYIVGAVAAVSILIALIIGIAVGIPLPHAVQEGFRGGNQGVIWGIPGFLIAFGVAAVNRNFAMALAFGSTRRDFWLGTTAGFLLTSLITATATTVLLAVERLTNYWLIGVRIFSVQLLGDGDYAIAFALVFSLCVLSLFAGAFFGTIYRAGGPMAVIISIIAVVLALAALIATAVWQRDAVWPVLRDLGIWSAVVIAAALAVAAALGSYVANQRATI